MRAVVQRVKDASVMVNERVTGAIAHGLLVLAGIAKDDDAKDIDWMVRKVVALRVFEDEVGTMNRSVVEAGGSLLIVSQFTLLGDCRKGNRPGWSDAAAPEIARPLYESFLEALRKTGITVEAGVFQADMDVTFTNRGPVTLMLDSRKVF